MSAELPLAFGRYTLTDHLGKGGMANVYLAIAAGESGFQRHCVIKRMFPEKAAQAQFVDMFANEAKIASRLLHPNIVQVYELGREGEELYMALEYVRGRDLAQLRDMCPDGLPPLVAAYIAREACRALAHAHEQGIVHRDVSPHNIMIADDGQVKLVDFGIAKEREAGGAETRIGVLKGKAAYLSPEQLDGHTARPPSDLFALGVVLHEMLTGRRLFQGNTDVDTMIRVKTQAIDPPSAMWPSIPPELDTIVMRALERDPSARYARASFMARELDAFLAQSHFGIDETAMFLKLRRQQMAGEPGAPSADMPTQPSMRTWPPTTGTRAAARRRSLWIVLCVLFLFLGAGIGLFAGALDGTKTSASPPPVARAPVAAAALAIAPPAPLPPPTVAKEPERKKPPRQRLLFPEGLVSLN
jgi:serine/threonine-protein kinase